MTIDEARQALGAHGAHADEAIRQLVTDERIVKDGDRIRMKGVKAPAASTAGQYAPSTRKRPESTPPATAPTSPTPAPPAPVEKSDFDLPDESNESLFDLPSEPPADAPPWESYRDIVADTVKRAREKIAARQKTATAPAAKAAKPKTPPQVGSKVPPYSEIVSRLRNKGPEQDAEIANKVAEQVSAQTAAQKQAKAANVKPSPASEPLDWSKDSGRAEYQLKAHGFIRNKHAFQKAGKVVKPGEGWIRKRDEGGWHTMTNEEAVGALNEMVAEKQRFSRRVGVARGIRRPKSLYATYATSLG